MAADTFDTRIDELERSYREAQERMGEPSVYNDHREAAEVGRRLKDLEPAYKLIQELRSTPTPGPRSPTPTTSSATTTSLLRATTPI